MAGASRLVLDAVDSRLLARTELYRAYSVFEGDSGTTLSTPWSFPRAALENDEDCDSTILRSKGRAPCSAPPRSPRRAQGGGGAVYHPCCGEAGAYNRFSVAEQSTAGHVLKSFPFPRMRLTGDPSALQGKAGIDMLRSYGPRPSPTGFCWERLSQPPADIPTRHRRRGIRHVARRSVRQGVAVRRAHRAQRDQGELQAGGCRVGLTPAPRSRARCSRRARVASRWLAALAWVSTTWIWAQPRSRVCWSSTLPLPTQSRRPSTVSRCSARWRATLRRRTRP